MAKPRKPAGLPSPQPVAEQRWDSLFSSLGRIEVVLLVGGVLMLLVLLYTIQSILSPFLALGMIIFLLYPLRRYLLARNVMWLGATLFLLWFFNAVLNLLAPFIVSLVFAYMLNPLVDLFQRWRVPLAVTSFILILLFVTGVVLIFFFVFPVALTQVEGMLDALANVITDLRTTLYNSPLMSKLERYGIKTDELRNTLVNQFTPRLDDILKAAFKAILSFASSVSSVVTQLFYVVLVPFLTFYILKDFPLLAYRFKLLFPRTIRDEVASYMERADDLISHYLRGAITVALLQGIITATLFSFYGIKYALLMGLFAALFDLIPYFGLIVMIAISAMVAAFSDPPVLYKIILGGGSVWFLHILETTILSPRIVGSKMGLHPLIMILSLLVFMYFFGFIGLLVAVPTTALLVLFIKDWEVRRKGGRNGTPAPAEL